MSNANPILSYSVMRRPARDARRNGAVKLDYLLDIIDAMTDRAIEFEASLLPRDIYELTHASDRGFDNRTHIVVPLSALCRDLAVGTATAGGNLVGSPRAEPAASLQGFSVVADAGALIINLAGGANPGGVPSVTAAPVAGWVATETGAVPESDAVFGLSGVQPKTVGFSFNISRRLLLQGGAVADALLRIEILKAIARAIDKAVLQGAGSGGEPLGLSGIVGVTAQSGTALGWAGIQAMLKAVATGGARDENVRFIGSPGVRELLAQRERAAGSGLVWDGRSVAGHAADVSLECPAASLFAGDFAKLTVVIHGGVSISLGMLQTSGHHRVVVMCDVDVQTSTPAAFARAASIT